MTPTDHDDLASGTMPVAAEERDTLPPGPPLPDRHDFTHWALEELLAKHRKLDDFRRRTSADLAMVANEVRGLRNAVESLVPRVTAAEAESRSIRESIREEIAQLRSDFEARFQKLETKAREGNNGTTEAKTAE